MKKRTFLSVLILLMVSLSYSLFSQQNTVQQNTVWEVVNFDETTVDRYPNIPFSICNNLIMDKVTKEGFLSTDAGLMATKDGGFNWEMLTVEPGYHSSAVVCSNGSQAMIASCFGGIFFSNNINEDVITWDSIACVDIIHDDFKKYPVEIAPKCVYYQGKYYFVAVQNSIWRLYTLDVDNVLQEVEILNPDNQNDGLWVYEGIIDIIVNNNTLYLFTDKGYIYVQGVKLCQQNKIERLDERISVAPKGKSYHSTNENTYYIVQDMGDAGPNYNISERKVKTVDDSLIIKTIKIRLGLGFNMNKIRDLIFVDNNLGFIIVESASESEVKYLIYSTKNGGLYWNKEYETEQFLNNLYSIDDVVYAIKERGLLMRDNSNEDQGSVTIAGINDYWVPAFIPARTPDTLRSVWCMSGDHCIAVGSDSNTIYRTRNSTDWVKEELDIDPIRKHPFYQIFFKDELIGSISSGLDVVFNTTDGGNTWTLEYTTNPDIEPGLSIGISPNGNIKLMSCQQGSSTYMTTGLATVPPTIPAYNRWNDLNTIGYLGYSINSLQFKNDNTVYAVGNEGGIYIYDCYYDSYFNTDRVTAPYRTQLVDQYGYLIYNNLRSIKIHDNIAYTVGDRGIFCKIQISDPYQTPRVIDSRYIAKNENMPLDLYSIDFKTPNNIYTVGDNIILNSTDGGATWQKQKIIDRDGTITDNFPYKLRSVFVADNYVYAVGVGDVILRGEIIQPASPTPDDLSSGTPTPQSAGKQGVIIDNQNISLFYPNPADKYIEFTNLPDNAVVKIIDILGREVFHGKINGNRLTVENYENGMYSVVISDGNKVKTGKFMVQH